MGGDGILLDSGNGRGQLGVVASVSDVASTKPMKQDDARDDSMKVGGAGVVELRGEDMQLDGGEPSLAAEINSENMARLAGMSAAEIAEAQADILNRMDPTLVEMLRQRGKERSGGKEGVGKDKGGEISRPGKISRTMPGDWLTAAEHSGHSWKAWSERASGSGCVGLHWMEISWGLNLFRSNKMARRHAESVAECDFLRTEEDPAAVGYTINDAVALTRSMGCHFTEEFD